MTTDDRAEGPKTDSSAHSASEWAAIEWLQAEVDALYERLQDPTVAAAARRYFEASPEELGRAAVAAAQRQRREGEAD